MAAANKRKFLQAAAANDLRTVTKLLQQNVAVDVRREDGDTALCAAIKDGNVGLVKLLLRYGADVHLDTPQPCFLQTIEEGSTTETKTMVPFTPLQVAAAMRPSCVAIVHALLDAGAEPRAASNDTITALDAAVDDEDTAVTELLLRKLTVADLNALNGAVSDVKFTPLMTAAKGGKLKQVQLLLKAGASVHQHQLEGDQEGVLHMAALTRGPECAGIIEALVQAGADVRATNVHRHTPLVSAVQADNEVAVKMLLASGSNPRVISPGDGCSLQTGLRLCLSCC
jgi:ankyrin repeat protein